MPRNIAREHMVMKSMVLERTVMENMVLEQMENNTSPERQKDGPGKIWI